MEKYFIALDKMSIDEIEIIRLLSRYSNYDTNVAGYTVNQLVVNADKRLNLTTQKVRTILKKLEKEGVDLIALTNLETVLHHAENMNIIDSEESKAIHAWQRKPSKWTK